MDSVLKSLEQKISFFVLCNVKTHTILETLSSTSLWCAHTLFYGMRMLVQVFYMYGNQCSAQLPIFLVHFLG